MNDECRVHSGESQWHKWDGPAQLIAAARLRLDTETKELAKETEVDSLGRDLRATLKEDKSGAA